VVDVFLFPSEFAFLQINRASAGSILIISQSSRTVCRLHFPSDSTLLDPIHFMWADLHPDRSSWWLFRHQSGRRAFSCRNFQLVHTSSSWRCELSRCQVLLHPACHRMLATSRKPECQKSLTGWVPLLNDTLCNIGDVKLLSSVL